MGEQAVLLAQAEDIPLDIVYEDDLIAVINKPQGMVTHPAAGSPSKTLVNAALYHIRDLSQINGVYRPGIVHRLDKDTSGLLAIAKTTWRICRCPSKSRTGRRKGIISLWWKAG